MASHAPSQLAESDEAAEQRWEDLDEAELDTEIEAYRESLRAVSKSLQGLGVSPDWEPDQDHLARLRESSDGNQAGEEGDADLRCSLGPTGMLHGLCSPVKHTLNYAVGWVLLTICTQASGKFPLTVSQYMPMSPRMTGDPLLKPPSSMSL